MALQFPISITPEHGYVALGLVAIPFHCLIQGFAVAGVRYRVFSQEYIDQNLKDENEALVAANKEPIKVGCHPDNGLGRLSANLPIADWFDLQNAQRAHLNYLETLPLTEAALAVSGYFYPKAAAILAGIHLIGRQVFCSGFRSRPSGRVYGFLILSLSNLAMVGLGAAGAIQLIRSKK
eukprot:CAMPEP_0201475150 /NCGR_PEP_ID=MMETSP0151_2-20130828/600_1 /ASSEMBLY_ACC=CAM_ASM_000257 /TAXON_ID=200890 /ORGANISM="Paramoeba atlantica, Strain 621/1 / CCAP 1560/9" /LENGTH=178 /DNA_ID=CAMNT_0047855165 /DNA_START=90 /DNA_END=626 /DNA_ORIENTATION=+